MILRFSRLPSALLISLCLFNAHFNVYSLDFDCHVTVNELKFDLTSLGGEHVVNQTYETPPTKMVNSLRFDLCKDLEKVGYLADQDQCPSGTRVCLTVVNQKEQEADRVTSVIPVVELKSADAETSVNHEPKSLSLKFQGAAYAGASTRQTLNLQVFCDPEKLSDPTFVGYDGSKVDLEWHGPAGCSFQEAPKEGGKDGDEKKPDSGTKKPEEENVGSGIGWFFLLLLLAVATYFGIGAYYNYTTYGAAGLDLIPHRDFWKEVPYMLSDVLSHLCSSSRPRRAARNGYISV